ncbi:MAG: hypothetical protein J6J23_07920, partial [Clostridia bacterium]|nr:hypothetical protein [Clostridia bacterium]
SFMNNLIFKLNSQHLLKNGAGRAHNDIFTQMEAEAPGLIQNIINFVVEKLTGVVEFLLRIIYQLLYFIVMLALNLMDFLMVIVSELSGKAQSFDLATANSNLENSDIIFKFLFNSLTLKILKRVFIYSILLLIIISIIAIVKNEWARATDEKARDAKQIIAKALKSVFVMFITPFFVIVGIIFSNVLLTSAINAISGDKDNFSVGSIIFMSGTYNANWYRIYADNNDKIPILFDFNGGFYNVENGSDATNGQFELEDEINALKNNSYLTSGYSTYSMFQNESYFTFNEVPEDSSYYAFYDGEFIKTNRIEYYVMADFVDYAMETGQTYYIKNVEDVYNTAYQAVVQAKANEYELYPYIEDGGEVPLENEYYQYFDTIFQNILVYSDEVDAEGNNKQIPVYCYNQANDFGLYYDSKDAEYFSFNVHYNGTLLNACGDVTANSTEVVEDGQTKTVYTETSIEYQALSGADDEAYGAKYVYCYKMTVPLNEEGSEKTTIYVPIVQNSNNNSYFDFKSDYLSNASETRPTETMFIARGAFNVSGFPTAIKESGSDIVFYRHDADSKGLYKVKPQVSYIETADNGNETVVEAQGDFFSRVLGFDQANVQVRLDVNGASMPIFKKSVLNITTFDKGLYRLNYSFVGTRLALGNVYDLVNINFVILAVACLQLMSTFFFMIFALMRRLLELTVFWFTYPAWLVKFPLDSSDNITEGTAHAMWRAHFIDRVLAVYTTYIGLAFFFALIPIIVEIDFAGTVVGSVSGVPWFDYIPPTLISWIIRTMFILVLFTMVDNVNEIINDLTGGGRLSGFDASGKQTFDAIKGNVVDGFKTFSIRENYKNLKQKAKNAVHDATMFIPGIGLIDTGVTAVRNKVNDIRAKRAIDTFVHAGSSGATDASVTSDIAKLKETMDGHDVTTSGGRTRHIDGFTEKANKIEGTADERGRLHVKASDKK